ncbi:gamma-glutamyl hydrolase A-like [Periplaneta americana]|uniref:gamma-glutamyl hydrolase A-like n=1 Tax=Periplaneta americana TaxID=6978 RepID=UPI0037E804B0
MLPRVLVLVITVWVGVGVGDAIPNNRPIIGVLSQELSEYMANKYPGNYSSYIAASYVKYLEGAGARVVPIKINQSELYYSDLVNSINGVLFPGGGANFATAGGYADAGWILYRHAIRLNQAGDYFPVWGTCLGFELLTYLATQLVNILAACDSENLALPVAFKPGFNSSRLFSDASQEILNILATENVTANFHHFCLTEENLTIAGLDRDWQVLSLNKDRLGFEFVSSFEHKRYPIYGVQFHPEKNTYEWNAEKINPHTANAILTEQYFANFFVNEARKSNHSFPTEDLEEAALIYNYLPTYTGRNDSTFEQCYFISE